jgi:hypothetical protein
MLRYIPSIPSFIRTFIMKGCWILSKAFFCIYCSTKKEKMKRVRIKIRE